MKHFLLAGCMAVSLLGSLLAQEHFWDEIPVSPSTTRPSEVLDGYWNSQFQRVNREIAAAKECRMVFFGDSITWSWSLGPATGKEIWEKEFGTFSPINMGNSGDITPVMLHRVTRGNLEFPVDRHPKVAVLLCGINNFGVTSSAGGKEQWELGSNCPPAEIAHGQRAIAQVFRRKLPRTRVIMLALLPTADRVKWEKCKQVNAIQAAVTRENNEVAFLDMQDRFLLPAGSIDKSLYTDGLHLTAAGYQTWVKGISAKLDEFMQAAPLEPVKIMFIGGTVTEGLDSSRAYRRYLDGTLRRKGHEIDFIGSRNKHNDDKSEAESYQFDPDHEGYSGKNFAWFAGQMPRLVKQNTPEIAVLQLGADEKLDHVTAVIAALRDSNPKVKIVVAHPTSSKGTDGVATLIKSRGSSVQSPIVLADIGMISDANAPDAEEARKIAAILAEALSTLLPKK